MFFSLSRKIKCKLKNLWIKLKTCSCWLKDLTLCIQSHRTHLFCSFRCYHMLRICKVTKPNIFTKSFVLFLIQRQLLVFWVGVQLLSGLYSVHSWLLLSSKVAWIVTVTRDTWMTMSDGPFLDSLIEPTWITLERFHSYSYWKPIFETIVLALVKNTAPKKLKAVFN